MSMRTALTGLNASQTELSTIANNIANAATTGFKRSRTEFADLFSADAAGRTPGTGVRVAGVTQQMKQGGLEFTGNALDLAINGNGFFMMKDGSTTTYTRSGNFRLDTDNKVVSATGAKLQFFPVDNTPSGTPPVDGQFLSSPTFPQTSGSPATTTADELEVDSIAPSGTTISRLEMDDEGVLRATYSDGKIGAIGKIVIATFTTPTNLGQVGDNSWRQTTGSGPAQLNYAGVGDRGKIEAGALESSNVEITQELVGMITAQRNFQANAKTISTADQVAQAILNIR